MTIEEIHTIVRPVEGWLSDAQMQTMYPFVQGLHNGALFVEIGSYHGRSTLFFRLTNPGIRILTIDPCVPYMANGRSVYPPPHIDDEVLRYGNIFQVVGTSHNIRQLFNWSIDAMFIDGDHTYEAIIEDANWLPLVKRGGIVMFHDYESAHEGVKKAVDELITRQLIKLVVAENTVCVTQRI